MVVPKLPLALQFSSASLGAVTMYRTTAELLLQTISEFRTSLRLFYQGVFLLGAFHVALSLQPMLSPPQEDRVEYTGDNENGMKIDIRYIPLGWRRIFLISFQRSLLYIPREDNFNST
jgi:hypothetical protein